MLYTLDGALFSSEEPQEGRGVSGSLPTATTLLPGPPGSGYLAMPTWRGEQLGGKFEAACPPLDRKPQRGMGTPFSDLQQLSIFAFPRVRFDTRCFTPLLVSTLHTSN